ncbi:helix-turn-helix transcriptional regulator [Ewingella sp. CoE-038-23]|uniref:helix-turn-helix transcriptional regulator n=1 Tax=Ewingella docleensis TaxID=3118588 RepID=UPI0033657141
MLIEKIAEENADLPYVSDIVMASERLIFNVTEDILLAMQDSAMTQTALAQKMGKSKAFVSQILDGHRNLTLKTLSDITYALGAEVKLAILKDGQDVSHPIIPERESYTNISNDVGTSEARVVRFVIKTNHMDYECNVAR